MFTFHDFWLGSCRTLLICVVISCSLCLNSPLWVVSWFKFYLTGWLWFTGCESSLAPLAYGPLVISLNLLSLVILSKLLPQTLCWFRSSVVSNLGFKMGSDLKLDCLIGAKPFLAKHHSEIVVHAFITFRLDYCNALYFWVSQSSFSCLQLVQNTTAHLLDGARKRRYITPILASLHWLCSF